MHSPGLDPPNGSQGGVPQTPRGGSPGPPRGTPDPIDHFLSGFFVLIPLILRDPRGRVFSGVHHGFSPYCSLLTRFVRAQAKSAKSVISVLIPLVPPSQMQKTHFLTLFLHKFHCFFYKF
jgi:hypothetical protein